MLTNKDILDWAMKKIADTRLKAMHAHKRGDTAAFENINKELGYLNRIALDYEKKVEADGNADV